MGTHGGRYQVSLAVIEGDAFERMDKVANLHLQGKSPYIIAKQLGITRVEAIKAVEQWQEIVRSDMESRDAARDHLNDMVKRYDTLIVKLNENLDELKSMTLRLRQIRQDLLETLDRHDPDVL